MRCRDCHHQCALTNHPESKTEVRLKEACKGVAEGFCQSKCQYDGTIYALNRGIVLAKALDPIEKKPLFHFYPGSHILSVGTFGCNLRCPWCQNWSLVAANPFDDSRSSTCESTLKAVSSIDLKGLAKDLLAEAMAINALGIAFTYNEPLMWHETVLAIAKVFKGAGLKTVMVSNGCASEAVVARLLPWIDAWNIDLKATDQKQYAAIGGNLEAVQSTVKSAVAAGAHVELTTLIVPGFNDSPEALGSLAAMVVDLEVPVLHLTRYYPTERFQLPSLPMVVMDEAYKKVKDQIAQLSSHKGPAVYLGNCSWADIDSYCQHCGHRIAQRTYRPISSDGEFCSQCGASTAFVVT